MPYERDITQEIRLLQKKYKEIDRSKRFSERDYLADLYEFYESLRDGHVHKRISREIQDQLPIVPRQDRHLASILVYATSDADYDYVRRWSYTVRFAYVKRKTWDDIFEFFKEYGGPRGCESAFAERKRKRKEKLKLRAEEDDDWD